MFIFAFWSWHCRSDEHINSTLNLTLMLSKPSIKFTPFEHFLTSLSLYRNSSVEFLDMKGTFSHLQISELSTTRGFLNFADFCAFEDLKKLRFSFRSVYTPINEHKNLQSSLHCCRASPFSVAYTLLWAPAPNLGTNQAF